MAQTAVSLLDVLREAWTAERALKQFEAGNGPVARIEKLKGTIIGKQAQAPVWKGRNLGGYTSVGPSGGNLNSAGQQAVDQAVYTLVYHYLSIELDASALLQAETDAQSVISAKDLEIEGGLENIRHQVVRQLMTNGDGIVAQCASGGASTTVQLTGSPSGSAYGYDAIIRGWLGVGSLVDIGTAGDTDALAGDQSVSAVSFSNPASPTITIPTSITTVAGTHFVFVANPNSATASNPEVNGLRNLVHTTGSVGGLNPANAGEEFFAAAARDTSTTVFSLDLALSLQRNVMQFSGQPQSDVWAGLKQGANFYSLLQNQARFDGDAGYEAGSVSTVKWNGMKVDQFPDVLDSDWYCLTLSDFCRVVANTDGPKWMSQLEGRDGPGWAQGTTRFKDALVYPMQVGLNRRNTHAAATGLTA